MPSLNDKKLSTVKRKRPATTHSTDIPSPKKKTSLTKTLQTKKLQNPSTKAKKLHDRCSFCNHFLPVDCGNYVCFTCLNKYSQPKTYKTSRRSISLGIASSKSELEGDTQKAIDSVPVIKPEKIIESEINRWSHRQFTHSRKIGYGKGLTFEKTPVTKLNSIENDLLEIKRMSEASNVERQKSLEKSRMPNNKRTKRDAANGEDESRQTSLNSNKVSCTVKPSKPAKRASTRTAKKLKYEDENELIRNANEDLSSIQQASISFKSLKSMEKASNQYKKKTDTDYEMVKDKTATIVSEVSSTVNETYLAIEPSKASEKTSKRTTKKSNYNVEIKTNQTDIIPGKTALMEEKEPARSPKLVEQVSKRSKRTNDKNARNASLNVSETFPIAGSSEAAVKKQVPKRSRRSKHRDSINDLIDISASLTVREVFPIAVSPKNTELSLKQPKKKTDHVEAISKVAIESVHDKIAPIDEEGLFPARLAKSIDQPLKRSRRSSKYKDEKTNNETPSSIIREVLSIARSSKDSEHMLKRSTNMTECEEEIKTKETVVPNNIASIEEEVLSSVRSSKSIGQATKRSQNRSKNKDEIKNKKAEFSTVSDIFLTTQESDTKQTLEQSSDKTEYVEEITIDRTDIVPDVIISTEEVLSKVRSSKSMEQSSKQCKRSSYRGRAICKKTASSTIGEVFPITKLSKDNKHTLKLATKETVFHDKIISNSTSLIRDDSTSAEKNIGSSKSSDRSSIGSENKAQYDEENQNSETPGDDVDVIDTGNEVLHSEPASVISECILVQSNKETECAEDSLNNGVFIETSPVMNLSKTLRRASVDFPGRSKRDKILRNKSGETISTANKASLFVKSSQSEPPLTRYKKKTQNDDALLKVSVEDPNNTTSNANETFSPIRLSESSEHISMECEKGAKFDENNEDETNDIANDGINSANKVLSLVKLSKSSKCTFVKSTMDIDFPEKSQNNGIVNGTVNEACSELKSPKHHRLSTSVEFTKRTQSVDKIREERNRLIANKICWMAQELSVSKPSLLSSEHILIQYKKPTNSDGEISKEETSKITNNTATSDTSSLLKLSQDSENSLIESKKMKRCFKEIQRNKTAEIPAEVSSTSTSGVRLSKRAKCDNNFKVDGTSDITKEACSSDSEVCSVVTLTKSTEQQSTKRTESDNDLVSCGTVDEIVQNDANINADASLNDKSTKSTVVTRSKGLKSSKEKKLPSNTGNGTSKENYIDCMTLCSLEMAPNSSEQNNEIKSPDKRTYVCDICDGVFNFRQSFRFHHNKCSRKSKIRSTVSVENDSSPRMSNIDTSLPSENKKSTSHEGVSNIDTVLPCLKTNELLFNSAESSLLIPNLKNTDHRNESRFNITEIDLNSTDEPLEIQNWTDSENSNESLFTTTGIPVDAIESSLNASELSSTCTEPFNATELYLGTSECLGMQNFKNTDCRTESYLNTTDCPETSLEIQNLKNTEYKTESLNVPELSLHAQKSCLNASELPMPVEESCFNASELSLQIEESSLNASDCRTESYLNTTDCPETSLEMQDLENTEYKRESSFNTPELSLHAQKSYLNATEISLPVEESCLNESELSLQIEEPCLNASEPSQQIEESCLNAEESSLIDSVFPSRMQNWENAKQKRESDLNTTELYLVARESLENQTWEDTECRTELALQETLGSASEEPQVNLEDLEFMLHGPESHLNDASENPEHSSEAMKSRLEVSESELQCPKSLFEETDSFLEENEPNFEECISTIENADFQTGGLNANLNDIDLPESSSCLVEIAAPLDESESLLVEDSSHVKRLESSSTESNSSLKTTDTNSKEESHSKANTACMSLHEFDTHAVDTNEVEFEILNPDSTLTDGKETQYYVAQYEYGSPFVGFDIEGNGSSSAEQANSRASNKSPFQFCPKIVDFFSVSKVPDNPKSKNSSNPESSSVSKSLKEMTAAKRIETITKELSCKMKAASNNNAQKLEGLSKHKRPVDNAWGSSISERKCASNGVKQPRVSESSLAHKERNSKEVFKRCRPCDKSLPVPSPSNSVATINKRGAVTSSSITYRARNSRQSMSTGTKTFDIQDTFRYHLSNFMNRNEAMIRRHMNDALVFKKTALNFLQSDTSPSSSETVLCERDDSAVEVDLASPVVEVGLTSPVAEETSDSANNSPLPVVDDSVGYSAGNMPETPSPSLSNPVSPLSCASLPDSLPHTAQIESDVANSLVTVSDEVIFTEDFRQPYDVSCRNRVLDSYLCHYCFKNLKKSEIIMHFQTKHNRTCKRNSFNLLSD